MSYEQPQVIWHNPSTLVPTQVTSPQIYIPIISDIAEILNAIVMIVVLMMIMPIMSTMMQGFGG